VPPYNAARVVRQRRWVEDALSKGLP